MLLMHGTTLEFLKLIADTGFRPDLGRDKNAGKKTMLGSDKKPEYGALGQGTYFGDSFAKVQTYSNCIRCYGSRCSCEDEHGEPLSRLLLLARVVVGIPHKVKTHGEFGFSQRQAGVADLQAGKHSVIGRDNSFNSGISFYGSNEFVIKDAAQTYPEFIVYWHYAPMAAH